MTLGSAELYELFLALAPARIEAARTALIEPDKKRRALELEAALLPFAVDAALLGADGLSSLAHAVLSARGAEDQELLRCLSSLESSTVALGHGDESGARVNESELLAAAHALLSGKAGDAGEPARPVAPVATSEPDDSHWSPDLPEDMIAAFLDECVERTESLSQRLLLLEERGIEPELVNEIFRDLHTLKGSSAFAGLKKMNRIAHLAEDLIGELRDGKRSCDRALIDVLLETLDVLKIILASARARQLIDVDVRVLLERLRDPNTTVSPAATSAAQQSPETPTVALESKRTDTSDTSGGRASTLRIEFEKVDLLLNLVGEIVLARGRLTGAAEVQSTLLREVVLLRKKLTLALGGAANAGTGPRAHPNHELIDDLQRTERVLRETFDDLDSGLGALGLSVGQLRDTVMKLRMVPIARLFSKYQRTVRELSHKLGKDVRVELLGGDTELDKVLVERLEDPLLHLVRNSVDHGIEPSDVRRAAGKPATGTVKLCASHRGGQILVTVQDDGAGMDAARLRAKAVEKGLLETDAAESLSDAESYELIFQPGFSTTTEVSELSGRGVGMDVVRDAISKLKGTIVIDSTLGMGTSIELSLPLTLAITQVLATRVGSELVAIPLDAVVSTQSVNLPELEQVADGVCLRVGGTLVPVVDLAETLGLGERSPLAEPKANVIIVQAGAEELGLLVEQVLGRHEVVIKSLGPLLSMTPCAAGATLIQDRVMLVVDLSDVAAKARKPRALRSRAPRPRSRTASRARLLLAEDSEVVRETFRRELADAGFEVIVAPDGQEALAIARDQQFDAIVTDVLMPKMDGFELVRALRADARYRSVPIVIVTSKDARMDTLRGYDSGADAYLTKPVNSAELVRTLERLIGSSGAGAPRANKERMPGREAKRGT